MTTTTATPTRAAGRVPAAGRARFRGLLLAEWTKLRSVRSTVWSLATMVVLAFGITGLATGIYSAHWGSMSPGERAQVLADPIGLILQPGSTYGQIAICVLGVMVMASEYSTGMIRASLLAVPRRTPMLAAKAAAFATVVFVVAELVAFSSFFLGQAMLRPHVAIGIGDPGVPRAILGLGLYLSVIGLFAMAIGAIVRHVAGAIAVTLGFLVVLSPLASLLPGSLGAHVNAYLPGNAGQLIMSSGRDPSQLLTPWQGFGVMCLWTVVLMALAALLLRRRDA
jgi:ABC-2 type transport system permease protein